jgi:hypothetical protein
MIKDLIIDKIISIKNDEEEFKSYWWKEIFVSYTKITHKHSLSKQKTVFNESVTNHISEVNFDELIDDDLVRLFEYIILTRNKISINRVDKQYFSEYDIKNNL